MKPKEGTPFKTKKLTKRVKVSLLTAVLAFISIILIVLFVSGRQTKILESFVITQFGTQQSDTVLQLAGRIEGLMDDMMDRFDAYSFILNSSYLPVYGKALYNSSDGVISSMAVFDTSGNVLLSLPTDGMIKPADAVVPKQAVLDHQYVSKILGSDEQGSYILARTLREDGGVIVARLNMTRLAEKTIGTARLGASGFAWLVDSTGGGVGYVEANVSLGGKNLLEIAQENNFTDAESVLNDMIHGESGFKEINWLGGMHSIAYHPIRFGKTSWAVGTVVPREELLHELNVIGDTTFIMTVLVLSLIFLSAAGWTYFYIRRGEFLESEVEHRTLQLRELNLRLHKRSTELNKSMKELRKKTHQLEKSNKELNEARIATMNILDDLNEAIKNMRSLEEVDRMKDEFITVVSHELKTPLTPMMAQLQLLLSGRQGGKLSPEQKESMEMILRNCERLNRLVKDVLDVSRIASGRLRLELRTENLPETIQYTFDNMKDHSAESGVKLRIKRRLPKKSPPIAFDKDRITQVVTNLLSNAIKFTPTGGTVALSAALRKREEDVLISVEDTGIGIPKKELKAIFTPFHHVDIPTPRVYQGTGLGLTICKGLIEGHGGRIWVESSEGRGSTFYFTLPLSVKKKNKEGVPAKAGEVPEAVKPASAVPLLKRHKTGFSLEILKKTGLKTRVIKTRRRREGLRS